MKNTKSLKNNLLDQVLSKSEWALCMYISQETKFVCLIVQAQCITTYGTIYQSVPMLQQ